jgi:hypothetical protein
VFDPWLSHFFRVILFRVFRVLRGATGFHFSVHNFSVLRFFNRSPCRTHDKPQRTRRNAETARFSARLCEIGGQLEWTADHGRERPRKTRTTRKRNDEKVTGRLRDRNILRATISHNLPVRSLPVEELEERRTDPSAVISSSFLICVHLCASVAQSSLSCLLFRACFVSFVVNPFYGAKRDR